MAYVISDIFYLYQESLFLKVAYYGVSRRISVHAGILSAVFVDGSVVVHNVDNRQIVSLSHFEVVGIVSRRDLYCAGTEIFFYVSIRYNGDKSAYERQNKVFAYQFFVSRIGGMYGNRSVTQNSFRSRGGDYDFAAAVFERITYVPKVGFGRLVFDFCVGNCRMTVRTPIDYSVSLINQTLVIHGDKGFFYGFTALFVHSKCAAFPIATYAHALLLFDDTSAEFFLPLECAL